MLPRGCLGNRSDLLLQQPAKCHLLGALAVLLSYLADLWILADLAPRKGRVRCERYAMFYAEPVQVLLVQQGMILYLVVADGRDFQRQCPLQPDCREVGYATGPD